MNIIRIATTADAAPMLDIYAPFIENTSFTFETEVPTVDAFKERINTFLQSWPWLVCEVDEVIAGYAYGTKHRERTAYQWSLESSVYVHDDYQRGGVGKALYTALIEILKLQQFRNVYAGINLPNDNSVAFHEKMGFESFAMYRNVGYKLGKWKTVGWWQLQLNEYDIDPAPPVKFSEIDRNDLETILQSASGIVRI